MSHIIGFPFPAGQIGWGPPRLRSGIMRSMSNRRKPLSLADLREERVVDLFRRSFSRGAGRGEVGIGDDSALVRLGGRPVLVTADHMVEGVHFTRRGTPPDALGYKLAAMNASDIAAMGGIPSCALLSLAIPAGVKEEYLKRLSRGLRRGAAKFGFRIVGGDTTASQGGIFASLTLLGTPAGRRPLLRAGARVGDLVWVTGHLGASAAGLAALTSARAAESPSVRTAVRRHLWPAPPLAFGAALGRSGLASAALDLSDGLSTDLARLCRESGAGCEVLEGRLPVRPFTARAAAALGLDPRALAVHGGEEYELLFTVRPSAAGKAVRLAGRLGTAVTAIGTITRGPELRLVSPGGRRRVLRPAGWQHF